MSQILTDIQLKIYKFTHETMKSPSKLQVGHLDYIELQMACSLMEMRPLPITEKNPDLFENRLWGMVVRVVKKPYYLRVL